MTAGRTDGQSPTAVPTTSRGVVALLAENCTSCMLCARECPDWCVYIDAHTETTIPEGGGRPRQTYVLDRFAIDFGLCMYCGICVDVCPFDALFWAPTYDYAEGSLADLLHEAPRLGEWLEGVPELAAGSKSGAADVGEVRIGPSGAGLDAP